MQKSDDNDRRDDLHDEYLLDDMMLTRDQMDLLFQPSNRRNGVKDPDLLWPGKVVPILISKDFSKSRHRCVLMNDFSLQSLQMKTIGKRFRQHSKCCRVKLASNSKSSPMASPSSTS